MSRSNLGGVEVSTDSIWEAIVQGDASTLDDLLRSCDGSLHEMVNAEGAEGQTPLHLACDINGDSTECVKVLCKHSANVNAEDAAQRTPLLVACEVKEFGAARYLLEHTDASLRVADENAMTPMHWLAAHGAAELLAACVAKGAEVDVVNSSGQTPLHLALMRGELACSFVLLDNRASPSALDDEKRTAMHLAMQHSGGLGACSESTLLLLRLLQLDPSLVLAADADKRTPLHWAAGKNAMPCVKALLSSNAEVDALDWAQRTPLHWAVLVDAAESAEALLREGANARHADRDRRTPLHWAADRAAEGCMKQLLSHLPHGDGVVDAVDWGGYTALHYAARRGAIGCVKLLLAHGANRRMVSMGGELPADLSSCDVTKALLEERIGMKRQRSLSSANSLVLFNLLPDYAKQFYDAWKHGHDIKTYLADELKAEPGHVLRDVMQKTPKVDIESMHVCTKTSKVVVELQTAAGSKAMHSLTFTDEGLVSAFVPYMCMVN